MFCEKLVCKYIQTLFTATNNKWNDSFYNKLSGLYNVVLGEDEDIFLQKITFNDVTTMDLKWRSKISTYMALVKSATQESTGCFLDEPKRKLLPRETEIEGKKMQ